MWGGARSEIGRQSQVYGAGVEYRIIDSGNSLRIRTEIMIRDVDTVAGHLPGESEEEEHDHDDEHDIANDFGSENSIWLQVGFNWGGGKAH